MTLEISVFLFKALALKNLNYRFNLKCLQKASRLPYPLKWTKCIPNEILRAVFFNRLSFIKV